MHHLGDRRRSPGGHPKRALVGPGWSGSSQAGPSLPQVVCGGPGFPPELGGLCDSADIEEKGVRMKLTVIDTPGFGDHINNENW